MCGIAGIIGEADEALVLAMARAQSHRGPDDLGSFVDGEAAVSFAHRRLSIIDLSESGRQPMSYGDGQYHIVYNGEIYNYRELRRVLQKRGCQFRTASDTEVILAAYAEWGSDCVDRLRGMFAFAVLDRAGREVFLARDRFGIKPVYYCREPGRFVFASEIGALMAAGVAGNRIDRQAVWDYLSLGSVPQPRTVLAGVKSLLPGHAMVIDCDGTPVRTRRYWNIVQNSRKDFPEASNLSYGEGRERLRELLEEAARLHMIADVPVGAFLSGGIDSTAMVGLMSQHVHEPIKTFTVGFESQHGDLNEFEWAGIAARRFATDHAEIRITDSQAADSFDDLIGAIDQPSMDGANTYFVAAAAGKAVKAVLSGLGGDELFAGYPHFRRHRLAARLHDAGPPMRSIVRLARFLPERFRHNLMLPALSPAERIATLRCLTYEKHKLRITSPEFREGWDQIPLEQLCRRSVHQELDPVSELSAAELEGYMPRTLLRDVDAMSMAHSLEVRPILLDHRLAEFAFALPPEFKIRGNRSKCILTDALADLIPQEIVNRPKQGFELPLLRWLSGPLNSRAQSEFRSDTARSLFTEDFLRRAVRRSVNPGPRDFRLWPYLVLISWMNRYGVSV